MAYGKAYGRCVKCNHKTINRCHTCSDAICYFHGQRQDSGQLMCFRCQAKYYIIEQEELAAQEEYSNSIGGNLMYCYDCSRKSIIRCQICDTVACLDHRTTSTKHGIICLECYRLLKEWPIERVREFRRPTLIEEIVSPTLGGES